MKQLLLMRHAKSDWSHPGQDDQDRGLNPRGQKDAALMGRFILRSDLLPERVFLSPAVRVLQTWEGMSASWPQTISENIHELYLASVDTLEDIVRQCPAAVSRLLLIAHNPGLEEAAALWCSRGGHIRMSTATLAVLEADVSDWSQLRPGDMTLKGLFYPRALKQSL